MILIVEKFLDWKISLTAENFLDCEKIPWLWKNVLIAKNFLDCGKVTFLTAEKLIALILLKANTNIEIIKSYILNQYQKFSLLTFFVVDKISGIFSKKHKHKY